MLTVYSLGFFLYPYKVIGGETTCDVIMAPATPGHAMWVGIKGSAAKKRAKQPGACPGWTVKEIPPGTSIGLKGADSAGGQLPAAPASVKRQRLINGLPPDPHIATSWANFDLIPDVSVFFDRATLRRDLAVELYSQIPLALGGEIAAVPDRHTLESRWSWESGHKQAVSALGRYQVAAFKKGVLSVGLDEFDLGSDAVVVFLHVPRTADENDRQRYDRGVDHHTAIMKLCEPEGRIVVHNPLENDPLPFKVKAQEFEDFAGPVLKCARKDTAKAKTPPSRDAGYPSCSSRRMKL